MVPPQPQRSLGRGDTTQNTHKCIMTLLSPRIPPPANTLILILQTAQDE